MKKIILLIALFLIPLAYAYATEAISSTTYLIYRSQYFPQDRYKVKITPEEFKTFISSGKKSLLNTKGQPFALTSYTVNYSGKYALWTISAEPEDISHIDVMLDSDYIKKINKISIIEEYSKVKGGIAKYEVTETFDVLPTDFYDVIPSTGT